MSNIGGALDMALDDVISQNRKQRKGSLNKAGPRRGGGSGGRTSIQKNRSPMKRSTPYSKPTRNNAPVRNNAAPSKNNNSLVVGNLHFNVTEKDLYDLFGQIGPLKRAFLHIGPNGKSAGIADIVFKNNNDAERARTTYNNVELDGRPMRITFASVTSAISSVTNKSAGNNRRPSGNNNNMRRTRGGGPRRRESRPKPNEQDLDADMDSYMAEQ